MLIYEIFVFDFLSFSATDILKMTLEGLCSAKFIFLILSFVLKTHIRVRNCLFCHVYGRTYCLKIVDNLIWAINLAEISSRDWQPSWIL